MKGKEYPDLLHRAMITIEARVTSLEKMGQDLEAAIRPLPLDFHSEKSCSYCGRTSRGSANFCGDCGATLRLSCSSCGQALPQRGRQEKAEI